MLLLFEDFRQLGKKMNRQEIKKEYSVTHMRGIVIYDTSYENTKIIAELSQKRSRNLDLMFTCLT